MSDPDLYDKDPMKRFAAQQRQKAKKSSNNTIFTPKQSNSPKTHSNNIDPEAAAGAFFLAGAAVAAVAVAGAAVAYGTVKITYEGVRRTLNKKAGLEADSNQNNEKAGWLTAGIFATAAAIGAGVYADNETQNKKFPAIALVFNSKGDNFVALNPDQEQARLNALHTCLQNSTGWFTRCNISKVVDSGTEACINYFSLGIRQPNSQIIRTYYHSITLDKEHRNETPSKLPCLNSAYIYGYDVRLCERSNKTTCNFN